MLNGHWVPLPIETRTPALDRALAAHLAGDLDAAQAGYNDILARDPGNADVIGLLAAVAYQRGRPDAALDLTDRALALAPDRAALMTYRGAALRALARPAEALAAYHAALVAGHDDLNLRHAIANVLMDLGRPAEAVAAADYALALDPTALAPLVVRGRARIKASDPEAALADFDRVLARTPGDVEAGYGKLLALRELGRLDDAIAVGRAVLADHPTAGPVQLELGEMAMLQGRYDEGWERYEWRYKLPHTERLLPRFDRAEWDGGPLKGRTLFIYVEQGYGDSIMFARFLARIERDGGRITLGVSPPLDRLMRQLPGIDRFITDWTQAAPFDTHLPLSSLPHRLGVRLDTITVDYPYFTADPARVAEMRTRIAADGRRTIGLVWTGRPENPNDAKRSIPPALLAPIGDLPNVRLVALQRGVTLPSELAAAGTVDLGPMIADFADMAAAIRAVDRLVTVDTAAAHVAGALDHPADVLLPFAPDWRWRPGNADATDWYRSLKLHRQPALGDWATPVERVIAGLA